MMRIRTSFLAGIAACYAAPALGQEVVSEKAPKPRTIKAFSLADQSIELRAVTRRAQADTDLRRAQLEESIDMGGVYPGYPQPAFVTIDFRVRF